MQWWACHGDVTAHDVGESCISTTLPWSMRSIAILESQNLLSSTRFSCPETMWFKLVQTKELFVEHWTGPKVRFSNFWKTLKWTLSSVLGGLGLNQSSELNFLTTTHITSSQLVEYWVSYVTCNVEQCSYSFALKLYVILLKYLYRPVCPAYTVLTHIKWFEMVQYWVSNVTCNVEQCFYIFGLKIYAFG